MSDADGLLAAYILDGQGAARTVNWPQVQAWTPEQGPLWVHLDRKDEHSQQWLREEAGLDATTCDAMLAEETRPRMQRVGSGVLLILRGVNLNPGAEPDDMISIRMWVQADRIISLRFPKLMAAQDVQGEFGEGRGPRTAPQVAVSIAYHLTDRMRPVMLNLNEIVDGLEEQIVGGAGSDLRRMLAELRRQAITLRRYIAPQRDAIAHLISAGLDWLSESEKQTLRQVQDDVTRYVEDLDALRERAAVVQEELANRAAEQMNRTMYVLSLVTAIFLPLGLLTGLLGINVGGMPGTENSAAFWIVCAILTLLGVVGVWVLRKMRLF